MTSQRPHTIAEHSLRAWAPRAGARVPRAACLPVLPLADEQPVAPTAVVRLSLNATKTTCSRRDLLKLASAAAVSLAVGSHGERATAADPGSAVPTSSDRWEALERALADYRQVLTAVRREHGGTRKMPAAPFFLFGMGGRPKFLYQGGSLRDARSGRQVHRWDVARELIVPSCFTVAVQTTSDDRVYIMEDEEAVWLEQGGTRTALGRGRVCLPPFPGRLSAVLKVLHQELLINVVDGKPVPNFFVYPKPWYRDGAMMAMALKKTGNLHLISNGDVDASRGQPV